MDIKVPKGLIEDHKALHTELEKIITEGGKSGEAAKALLDVMEAHMEHEEKFALPPLGLLPVLTQPEGKIDYQMGEAVEMANTLKAEMPRMLAEHRSILAAAVKLENAIQLEGKKQYQETINWIVAHIKEEEEVYYPAALLVGAFLRVKLALVFNPTFP